MFKKIKNYMLALAMITTFAAPVLVPIGASADLTGDLCKGTNLAISGSGGTSTDCSSQGNANDLGTLAAKVVNFLSVIVGVVAVIMIIVGGFRYITSGGESSNVSGAKNTLIYAIVGLVIVALAQFIVHFVLNNISTSTQGL